MKTGKEFSMFGDIEIKSSNFHCHKSINISLSILFLEVSRIINIEKVLVSNKICSGEIKL